MSERMLIHFPHYHSLCQSLTFRFQRDVSHAFFAIPILFTTILGSRLILNLREVYYRPYEEELETVPNNDHPLVFLSTHSDPNNILITSNAAVYTS